MATTAADHFPAGRQPCPVCGNRIGAMVTPEGSHLSPHRKSKTSMEFCTGGGRKKS